MALSKTNIIVVLLVGFVNYLEWAIVMTSIYPYILSVSIFLFLFGVRCIQFVCDDFFHYYGNFKTPEHIKPEMVSNVHQKYSFLQILCWREALQFLPCGIFGEIY